MKKRLHVVGLILAAVMLTAAVGCVERRMTIVSDPPGAVVIVNGREVGATPVDVPSHQFIWYGKYDVLLVKDGFETLLVSQEVPPPWYERFPLDFFSENVWPWHVKDHRLFTYQLAPTRIVPPEELLQNANLQRSRGQGIGMPLEVPAELVPAGVPGEPATPPGNGSPPVRPPRLENPVPEP